MKKIITIDCDNVLCDSARTFLDRYNEKFWEDVSFDAMTKPYIHEIKDFTHFDRENPIELYIEFFVWAHEHSMMRVFPWAQEWVKKLLEKEYELHVLTGRVDAQKDATIAWVEKYFPWCFEAIHFTNDMTEKKRPKWAICKELGAIAHLDDFYHYAESIIQYDIPVYLFDAPWNQKEKDAKGIERIAWWSKVWEYL